MKVYIEKTDKRIELNFNGDVKLLLKKLKINPEEVIVIKDNEVVSEDEKISDKDSVKILSVVSGG